MSVEFEKIQKFLESVEGKPTCVGYIPCKMADGHGTANYKGTTDPKKYVTFGVSGVTIGVGVDLGQQTMHDLHDTMGLSDELCEKLQPFVGKKGRAALYALHEHGVLRLTQEETDALTYGEQSMYLNYTVIPCWHNNSVVLFEDIPWQAQAVYYSLLYQCGPAGARRRAPVTLDAMYGCNWRKASAALMDRGGWNGEYVERRYTEGKLLAELC